MMILMTWKIYPKQGSIKYLPPIHKDENTLCATSTQI